mgnify:FL=1
MKRLLYIIIFICSTLNITANGTIHLEVGETKTLDVAAMNVNYSWSVSCSCVDVIGGGGNSRYIKIRGHKAGVGSITCSWTNAGFSNQNSWTIVVEEKSVKSVKISPSSFDMKIGESKQLTAIISPSDAKVDDYSWGTTKPNVLKVSGNGKNATIVGRAVGEANVFCVTDNGTKGTCKVRVVKDPTAISLPKELYCVKGQQYPITPTFTPSDAWSKITWSTSNTIIAYFNDDKLVANSPGECTITATTENGLTATAKAIVSAPEIKYLSFSPTLNQTGVSVLAAMTIDFNVPIYLAGANTIRINAGSNEEEATLSTSGSTCTIKPVRAMKPLTKYDVTLPIGMLKDDYDNKYNHSISMSFTTGTLQPLSLNVSHESSVLKKGTEVKLTASDTRATIRYTLDGSEPNESSNVYTTAIIMNYDAKLRAKAYLDGFECPEISRNYIITDLEYVSYYPAGDNDMFTYKDLNPYVELSDYVEQGEKWDEMSFTSQGINVEGKFFLSSKRIVFVPKKPLDMGKTYEMVIPEGAVCKKNSPNMATTWKFKTGDYVKSITAGEKLSAAILSGDIMVYWGTCWYNNMWTTCSPAKDLWPVENVSYVSSGYSQLVYPSTVNGPWNILQTMPDKNEEQINWVERQYDTTNTIWVAGGQTTAVIKDGILKMAGRNDFGQVGKKEEMVYKELQTIDLSNVKQVVPTMYTTFALTEDGSLYGWGYNGYGLFLDGTHKNSDTPKLIMKDVASVAASKFGSNNVAVITKDGKLLTWGENQYGQIGDGTTETPREPKEIFSNVKSVAVGYNFMAAVKNDGSLWMWGDNKHGQLTSAIAEEYTATPTRILEDVDSVDVGLLHILALKDNGSVWAWGCNRYSRFLLNSEFKKHIDIIVPTEILKGRPKAELISLDLPQSDLVMRVGEECMIFAKPNPISAAYEQWKWTSENEDIADVTERGIVSALKEGKTKITLSSDNGVRKTINVLIGNSTGIASPSKDAKPYDIYDISGRKVKSRTTSTNGLRHGIYIINGKKYLK